jgi:hypothetical protein
MEKNHGAIHQKIMKERDIDVLADYKGSTVKIPHRCKRCGSTFLRTPTYMKRSNCPGCQTIKPLEEWIIWFISSLDKNVYIPQHRIYLNSKGGKTKYYNWDVSLFSDRDIFGNKSVIYIDGMERNHFSFPNDRIDNQSIDSEVTFKFRKSDYYKWLFAFRELVPIMFINEHQLKEKDYVKKLRNKIEIAYDIANIKSKKKKLEKIIEFFEFPAPKLIPYQDYNEYQAGFLSKYPIGAKKLCEDYNERKSIDWRFYINFDSP